MAHTETPWMVDSDLPPNGRSVIARVGNIPISGNTEGSHAESDDDNAQHICRCVNAFDHLKGALGEIQSLMYSAENAIDKGQSPLDHIRKAFGIALNTLKRAEA